METANLTDFQKVIKRKTTPCFFVFFFSTTFPGPLELSIGMKIYSKVWIVAVSAASSEIFR